MRLFLEVIIYALALWLGLYLLARDWQNAALRWAGLGLMGYALALALTIVIDRMGLMAAAASLIRLQWFFLFVPVIFWLGAIIALHPERISGQAFLTSLWQKSLLSGLTFFYAIVLTSDWFITFTPAGPQIGAGYLIFAAAVITPILLALVLSLRVWAGRTTHLSGRVVVLVTLFFGLGTGLILFPLPWLPRSLIYLAIGLDLLLLGVAIAAWDAFDLGETLLPHFVFSFDVAFFTAFIFGGQVALVMLLGTGVTVPMLVLLMTTIAAAFLVQTFANPVQDWLEKFPFINFPQVRQQRAELRTAAAAATRFIQPTFWPDMDEQTFIRHTRRALSHMSNIPRLAANPLTQHPLVTSQLSPPVHNEQEPGPLERANALKGILTESILRLKPRDKGEFGTSDEWRHYNALYFPYVMGLRPYSRRAGQDDLPAAAHEALNWFRSQIPERTLYNRQHAAAELIAQDLRQRTINRE